MTLLEIHLFAAAFWFGLLTMETVMELYANNPARREVVAKIHGWTDPLFELPAVTVLLVTGIIMLMRIEQPSGLLILKIVLGGGAILTNYWCYTYVFRRFNANDEDRIIWTRKIALTGVAIPPAIIAFVLGMFVLR